MCVGCVAALLLDVVVLIQVLVVVPQLIFLALEARGLGRLELVVGQHEAAGEGHDGAVEPRHGVRVDGATLVEAEVTSMRQFYEAHLFLRACARQIEEIQFNEQCLHFLILL